MNLVSQVEQSSNVPYSTALPTRFYYSPADCRYMPPPNSKKPPRPFREAAVFVMLFSELHTRNYSDTLDRRATSTACSFSGAVGHIGGSFKRCRGGSLHIFFCNFTSLLGSFGHAFVGSVGLSQR